ncbi:hypothetical protein CsatB_026452 [Cannabis sativa]
MPRSELKLRMQLGTKMLELLAIHQKENVSTAMRKAIGNPNVLSISQRNKLKLLKLGCCLSELDKKAGWWIEIVYNKEEALSFELIV